jgi:hypothetical protein
MYVWRVGRGPPGRSEWQRIVGWDPLRDGACALAGGIVVPGWKGRVG